MNKLANESLCSYRLNIYKKNVEIIEKYWKIYVLKKKLKIIHKRNKAASKIQKFYRKRIKKYNINNNSEDKSVSDDILRSKTKENPFETENTGKLKRLFYYGNFCMGIRTIVPSFNFYDSPINPSPKKYGSYKLNQHAMNEEVD